MLEICELVLEFCREPTCFEELLQKVFQHYQLAMIADVRRRFFGLQDYQQRTQDSHRAIYQAVMDRDAARAKREMVLHLAIVEEFSEKFPERD